MLDAADMGIFACIQGRLNFCPLGFPFVPQLLHCGVQRDGSRGALLVGDEVANVLAFDQEERLLRGVSHLHPGRRVGYSVCYHVPRERAWLHKAKGTMNRMHPKKTD